MDFMVGYELKLSALFRGKYKQTISGNSLFFWVWEALAKARQYSQARLIPLYLHQQSRVPLPSTSITVLIAAA